MRIAERLMQTRTLLVAMISLQVLWLAVRWLLGTPPNWRRIPLLLISTVVFGVAIAYTPASLVSRMRRFKEGLIQNEKLSILTLCVIVLTFGAAFANYHEGHFDEVSIMKASKIVAEEGVARFFADYVRIPWLGRQHPPLVPLVYGLTMRFLGVNLFVLRLVSLVLGMATILITYFLGKELYDRYTGLLAALFLLSFRLFLHISAAALTDMPVTFFFSLALLLTLRLPLRPTIWRSAAIGLLIGSGLLSKYTMVLIYMVLLGTFAVDGSFRQVKFHLGVVTLVSVGMLASWFIYADQIGVFALQSEVIPSYVTFVATTDLGKKLMLEALSLRLPSALGAYTVPLVLLGGLDLMRRRNQSDLFVLLWIAMVSLPLMLTLPINRYFMPAFPAVAIVMARGIGRIPEAAEQVVALALLYCGLALSLSIS